MKGKFSSGGGKGKKKSKGSKGSSKAKEQWSHDGGALFAEGDARAAGAVVKKGVPRRTQEKDEWKRRGRLKFLNRQQNDKFARKMNHKVSYSDVVDESEDEAQRAALQKKTKIAPPAPNKVSPLLRLRQFVCPTNEEDDDIENDLVESGEDDHTDNSDEGSDELDEIGQHETTASASQGNGKLFEEASHVEEIAAGATLSELVLDAEDSDERLDYWRAAQFLSGSRDRAGAASKPVLLETAADMEVLGTVDVKSDQFARIRTVGDVSCVPSIFQARAQVPVGSPLTSLLLSYLQTYGDIMIEGRDHHNDADIARAIMFHTAVHLVKSK
jgi:hypothetical protein